MALRKRAAVVHGDDTGIDLAPMLDFVLNLLIFFIITAVFVKEIGLTVSRPNAANAEKKEAGNILVLIRPGGEIVIDGRVIDVRAVRANIERLHAQRPEQGGAYRRAGAGHRPGAPGRRAERIHRGIGELVRCSQKVTARKARKPASIWRPCSTSYSTCSSFSSSRRRS
jgi:biopolymer transport protein ExbD